MSVRAEFDDEGKSNPRVIKSRVAGGLLATMLLACFALANLPYQYVESESEWFGYLELADGGGYRSYQSLPTMAGWPMRYWIRYNDGVAAQHRLWRPERLFINLGIGVALASAVYLFVQLRRMKLTQPTANRRVRMMLDGAVALSIVAAPGITFAMQYPVTHRHRQLAKQLGNSVSANLSCWLPAPLDPHVPPALKRSIARLRQVHVLRPTAEQVDALTSIPTLIAFHCYAGECDARHLSNLLDSPHFSGLQLSARDLSDADIEQVSKLKWLGQLRLRNTSLNAAQLKKLDHLSLRLVDLSFTQVQFSELGKPGWSDSVRSLRLSRPADGIEASLTLQSWPNLRDLRIQRTSNVLNDAVLSLTLIDLPRLERVNIDRTQKHDLVLKNVPRLERIEEDIADLRYIINQDLLIPGLSWFRSIDIDGAGSLRSIGCFARDLEHFSIRRAPGLRWLAIGSYLSTLFGEITPQPVDADRCEAWIQQLGEMDGPPNLDLAWLPLHNNDLAPLTANKRVRHLHLHGTGLTFPQLQQLAGMDQVEGLHIRSTPLHEDELTWLLDRFPKLTQLTVDAIAVSRIDLSGRNHLRELRVSPMTKLHEFRIVDMPRIRTAIRMTNPPDKIQIRNALSLRGLAVEGPWPADTELNGLRDLEFFTGGGKRIDDRIAGEILNCASLDRLTFAYCSLSQSALRRIGSLNELTFLAVPGADVTDDVVHDWKSLTNLWEINLDDTKVSHETIHWLGKMESLRRLSLNRVPVSDEAADALADLTQISELYLAGVELDSAKLRPILQRGTLETLDLSGWKVDEELLKILCTDGAELKHLILHDTSIDRPTYERLFHAAPDLYVDIGSVPNYLEGSSLAELHRRADSLQREMNTGWRVMLKPRDEVFQTISTEFASTQGEGLIAEEGGKEPSEVLPMPVNFMSQLSRQRYAPEPSDSP